MLNDDCKKTLKINNKKVSLIIYLWPSNDEKILRNNLLFVYFQNLIKKVFVIDKNSNYKTALIN